MSNRDLGAKLAKIGKSTGAVLTAVLVAAIFISILGLTSFLERSGSGLDAQAAEVRNVRSPASLPSVVCLRGVAYYSAPRRLAPAFKPDGTLYSCEEYYRDE